MNAIIKNTCWVFGDGISTDHITPAATTICARSHRTGSARTQDADLNLPLQPHGTDRRRWQTSARLLADMQPVLKERGIPVVLAQSFARIFYRNMVMSVSCRSSAIPPGLKVEMSWKLTQPAAL